MQDYTKKESPGCIHDMIRYLCELENTTREKTIIVKQFDNLYTTSKKGKKLLKYKSYDITVVDIDGSKYPFYNRHERFDKVRNYTGQPLYFICIENKWLQDFKTKPEIVGKYNDSLGGGWYSKCILYKVNDKYFTDMDCSC